MRLSKMLEIESKSIKKNKEVGTRTDCTDLLISAKFANNNIHHILPGPKAKEDIIEDLAYNYSDGMQKTLSESTIKSSDNKPPNEIIFKNRQAFGDILTMTAAIRDFKNSFPNTRIGVQTTAMHIWDHNPHIDHSFRTSHKKDTVLEVGPGFLTNKSNRWNFHMCNAFRMDIQNKLKLKIEQGPITPDIWMTKEEYDRKPIIDGPYWIFIYGGEPGWPVKQYHRWQEVINILKDEIQFVQLGVKKHPYPVLENVIDYVGKTEDRNTGIRDLFNIFLHSQGSLGLVSMHMHLSAAFGNPCVVLAGAREPAWFTNYYGHQYIQTNGTVPCAQHTSCWSCKLQGCKNLVDSDKIQKNHNTKQVPKCVDIIEPEEIAEGIRKYYKGGRLEYGKKIPNKFFKNVVKKEKIFTVPETSKVDNELLKKYGFEWGGGSITDRDWLFIQDIMKDFNVKNVLEFGAGLSTLLFGTKAEEVVTFETQPGWIKKIKEKSDKNVNVLFHWDGKELLKNDHVTDGIKFDLAFVDGPAGGQNREFSVKYASILSDLVIIHDAGREWERKWQKKYLSKDFEMLSKGGHRCHLWQRKNKIVKPKLDDSKPTFRMITTCRGYGGSERSSLHIMKQFLSKGYNVELLPSGNISGEYQKNIPKEVIKRSWDDIADPIDVLCFYTSDTIWGFHKKPYINNMHKINAKRKTMILNYQLGGAGNVEWTKGWDLYMFLNSTKEGELLKRMPDVKTRVLPPPTDISEFLKVKVSYDGPLRLIRHNSQKDAKHAEYTNEMIKDIWEIDKNVEFFYMPPRSDCMDDSRIHKFRVNQVTVPEFLKLGNCFWYHLPPGYQDQGPRVIIEAMACGLPVIADNSYGAKDRVTEETGWLCDSREDYYEVVKEIVTDPSILEKKGKKAKKHAIEEFVPENWSKEIEGNAK